MTRRVVAVGSRHPIGRGVLVACAIVGLIVVGSLIYWLADGRGGTPDDFRQRVSHAGLNVAWSNSGPRGGSGSVDTSCGRVEVTIDLIEDELWIRWADHRQVATPETIDALLSCSR